MPSLVKVGLSYINANYVFSQFVNLYIISNGNSAKYRYSYDNIYNIAQNVDKLLIPYKTWIYPELKYKIDENLDVIKLLGYKPNKKSRDISLHILAADFGCSIDNYKQKLFEQLDKMNPDLDKLIDLSIKNADLKEEQSDKLNIHPNDTPAKIMMELLDEYYVIHKDKLERKDQIFRETLKKHSELVLQQKMITDVIEIFREKIQFKTGPIINEKDRFQSKTILASKVGCSVQNLKENVFKQFDSVHSSIDEVQKLITKHNLTKVEHAIIYNIHPNDTPAAVMIEMLEEYILILKYRKKTDNQIFREMATIDPDLMTQILVALSTGETERYNELIAKNPKFLDNFIDKISENEDKID
jgi:hypothetical protein